MNISFLDLHRQYKQIKKEVNDAIQRVLDGQHFILGDELVLFENQFAHYLDISFCCGVASGTDGLILALKSMGIGKGDEVLTPALSFIATSLAITEVGATPVFVDIDPDTYQIDCNQILGKITNRTKAILPVHLYGSCCDINTILDISKEHGLKVIEDSCQAHGAHIKGKKAGTFSDIGVFSFYPGKNLGAYGDGGAICVNSEQLRTKIQRLRNYGQKEKYIHQERGINSRLDNLQAAVLKVKLKYLDEWNHKRNKIADIYKRELCGIVKFQKIPKDVYSCYHLFVIEAENREGLINFLSARNVKTLIHYPLPIHLQKTYQDLGNKAGCFPRSEKVSQNIVSLPIYAELAEEEVLYITESIKAFYE